MPLRAAGQGTPASIASVHPVVLCLWGVLAMPMPRPESSKREVTTASAGDDVLRGWLPVTHDHLVESTWADGKRRLTTTVMVLCEGGRWKAWIHDRDAKVSAWVSAESWESLWETVEKGLRDDTCEWRSDRR